MPCGKLDEHECRKRDNLARRLGERGYTKSQSFAIATSIVQKGKRKKEKETASE